jgi:hypothetical protein
VEEPRLQTNFLGLPLLAWGLLCLALAVLWAFVWPVERAVGASGLRLAMVRWGHSLVWLLLALMCFLRGSGNPAAAGWGNIAGLASLAVYLAFLAATFVIK